MTRLRPRRRTATATSARADARLAYLFLAPALAGVVFLIALPMMWNVAIALQEIRLIDLREINTLNPFAITFTFANFEQVLGASDFWPLLIRTVCYAGLGAGLATLLGLWAALALRRPFFGRSVVRGLMLVPYILPLIAVVFVWRTMLSPQYGIVNAWLGALTDAPAINFLNTTSFSVDLFGRTFDLPLAFSVVIAFDAWRHFPIAFLFILARLQLMSKELDDAAIMDGATISQRFRYVVLPDLKGLLIVLFAIRFIWNFNDFSSVYLLTGGGAGTRVIAVQIYDWMLGRSDPGAAGALALVLAGVLAVCMLLYFRAVVRRSELV